MDACDFNVKIIRVNTMTLYILIGTKHDFPDFTKNSKE